MSLSLPRSLRPALTHILPILCFTLYCHSLFPKLTCPRRAPQQCLLKSLAAKSVASATAFSVSVPHTSTSSITLISLHRTDPAVHNPTRRVILHRNARSSIYKLQPLGRRRILLTVARCQFSYPIEQVLRQVSRRR